MRTSHPVVKKLNHLRVVESRWKWLFGFSVFASAVLLLVAICSWIDFVWRSESFEVRAIFSALFYLASVTLAARIFCPLLLQRRSVLDVARDLERSDTSLGRRLSLAIDFLTTPRQLGGSRQLKDRLISNAAQEIERQNLIRYLQRGWPLVTTAIFAGLLLIGFAVATQEPQHVRIAWQRLMNPWTSENWPDRNRLEFAMDVGQVASGESVDLIVVDRNGALPDRVVLQIEDATGARQRQMKSLGIDELRTIASMSEASNLTPQQVDWLEQGQFSRLMHYRLETVRESFRIRAVGGDGETEWQSVEVLEPPVLEKLKVEVIPPSYTGLDRYSAPLFQEIWAGSKVAVTAKSSTPLAAGELRFVNDVEPGVKALGSDTARRESETNESLVIQPRIPEGLASREAWVEDRSLRVPIKGHFKIRETAEFRILVSDSRGTRGGRRRVFRIPTRQDAAPTVTIGFDSARPLYPPQSKIDVDVRAFDDMRLDSLVVQIRVNQQSPSNQPIRFVRSNSLPATDKSGVTHVSKLPVDFSQLSDLKEGDSISIQVVAVDAAQQRTESNRLEARIGSEKELEQLRSLNRSRIISRLQQAAQLQTDSTRIVSRLLDRRSDSETRETAILRAANFQRMTSEILFESGGVIDMCDRELSVSSASLQAEDDLAEMRDKLAALRAPMRDVIDRLNDRRALNAASWRPTLRIVSEEQTEIESALRELVGAIDAESRRRAGLLEIAELVQQQLELRQAVQDLQVKLLSNASAESDRARSQRLHVDQKSLADRLGEIAWSWMQDAKSLDSNFLRNLSQVTGTAEFSAASAAQRLAELQLGPAITDMKKTVEILNSILDRGERPNNALGRAGTEEQIGAARSKLESIRKAAGTIRERLANWDSLSESEREKLISDVAGLSAGLQKLAAESGEIMSDSARSLVRETGDLLDQLQSDLGDEQLGEASKKMEAIAANLDQLDSELARDQRESARQARLQRYRELQKKFQRWRKAELEIHKRLTTIEEPAASAVYQKLAEDQSKLNADFAEPDPAMDEFFALRIPVQRLQLKGDQLVQELKERKLVDANRTSLEILQQLDSLADPRIKRDPPENGKSPADQNSETGKEPAASIQISEFEVQLMRRIQEEIYRETEALRNARETTTDARQKNKIRQQALNLSARQGELIETIDRYLQSQDLPTNSKPATKENLPEIPQIPEFPEIPPIDCTDDGWQQTDEKPASTDEQGDDEGADAASNRSVQSDPSQQDQVEAVNPFKAKPDREGEDLGEAPDDVRNRLEQVKQKMIDVQELLIQERLSSENTQLQQDIIDELKLFATEQQKKSQGKSKRKPKGTRKGEDAANQPGNSTDNRNQNVQDNGASSDYEEAVQRRIDSIWGHLPEQMRPDQMNIRADDFLPKYRELIKEYFKTLAKEPAGR